MNILVTGGAGFIGSHLCKHLLEKSSDNNIICVDNLFTGAKKNIDELIETSGERFTFIEHDIISPLYLQKTVEQIYNMACPASPVHYQYNAIRTIKANTIGVINMLGLAKFYNARILQASTSEVYGDPVEHPQKESYRGNVNCIGPRACYDEGKRVAETLFFDYNRRVGVEIRIARIFNTYGPNMHPNDGRVVSNFIVQAKHNKDITVYGDGTQTRSFCYVSDLVEGLYRLMNCEGFTGPVNLGNPDEYKIKDLAEKVIAMTDSQSKVIFTALPEDDPKVRKPDITLAKNKLSWEPKVSLEDGLAKTIDYFLKTETK